MTVKEAIDRLKYDREMCYFDPSTGETGQPYNEDCKEMAEALDIAIEALECEPVGDCISRQAAIDYLLDALYDLDEADYVDKEFIEEELKRVPPIQPEQKTGRWIYMKDCEDWYYADEYLIDRCDLGFEREEIGEREEAAAYVHKQHGKKWRKY